MKNNKLTSLLLVVFAIAANSCQHDMVEYVSFDNEGLFTPYLIEEINLDDGIPYTPSLEGFSAQPAEEQTDTTDESAASQSGVPICKTTSLNEQTILKEILGASRCHTVHSISGTYTSVDQTGATITLSGKIMLPAKGDIKNVILVSHYTIGANFEAPSECFQMEGIIVPMGYAMVFSDYIGFGITKNLVHPYLCANTTARNVVDMFEAVMPYLDSIGRKPLSNEVYLMGYSQGGATTIAVQRILETSERYAKYPVRRNFAGAGPYDIAATYDDAVNRDYLGIPCAIPMIIQGMNVGENLNLDYKQFFKPILLENLDEWINSKKYTVAQIGYMMGMNRLSEFMTEEAMEKRAASTSTLYRAMLHNSIVAYDGWSPSAPIYMFHSQDDDTVPFLNSQRAKAHFSSCNIEYNFGHYGNHALGCVRFIGCVKELLENDTDIKKY